MIVKPETVLAWHRRGFRLFWTWKSRRRLGRPGVPPDVRQLIRTMAEANPLWGAPRIHGELLKLGIDVSQATVAKYMPRHRRPPSQTWRTFLTNHVGQITAADFFVVPTATYRLLFVLVILAHERRRVVHVAVTAHPTAAWTAQQLREAFPGDEVPRYLIRDRDAAFAGIGPTATGMGIHEVLTAPRSPWQNAYAERLIGSIRRECLDHVIVVNEIGLSRILTRYLAYYHESRTHLSLAKDSPQPRPIAPPHDRPGRRHSAGRRPTPSLRPSGGVVTLPCHCQAVGLGTVGVRLTLHDRAFRSEFGAPTPTIEQLSASAQSTSPHTTTGDRSSLGANRVFSRDTHAAGEMIPWKRVYLLPDFVFFSHKHHAVGATPADCELCHGPVRELDVMRRVGDISMAACTNCHQQKQAPTHCDTCHDAR